MKLLSCAALTVVLAGGAAMGHASGVDQHELEQCRAQVGDYYGGADDMQYVGKRQFHDGTQIKLAVRSEDASTGYTTTRLANCWLGAENTQAYSGNSDGSTKMVADAVDTSVFSVEDPLLK